VLSVLTLLIQCRDKSDIKYTSPKLFLNEVEKDKKKEPLPIGGGIHDHLYSFDREKLIAVTLAVEKYHRKILKEENFIGGIHDYVWRIPDDELRSYIIREVNEHPEINDITVIEEMAKEYEKPKEDEFELGPGVHDYLNTQERDNLIQMALKMERYHRKQVGTERFLGGLHDYVFYLPNQEIHNYVVREIKCHPELNKVEELQKLIKEDTKEKKMVFLEEVAVDKVDSLAKAINGANREKLELTLAELNKQLQNKYKFLLDFLHPFTNEDIRMFIRKIVEENKKLLNLNIIDNKIIK